MSRGKIVIIKRYEGVAQVLDDLDEMVGDLADMADLTALPDRTYREIARAQLSDIKDSLEQLHDQGLPRPIC